MTDQPSAPQQAGDTSSESNDKPQAAPRKKRHRILKTLIALLVLIVVLVAVAPMILSTSAVTNLALRHYSDSIRGRIEADNLDVGWFSSIRIDGLRIYDPSDREVVRLDSATTEKGLWGTLMGWYEFGQVGIHGPAVDLYVDENGKVSLAEAFEPVKPKVRKPKPKKEKTKPVLTAETPPRGTLTIDGARVTTHLPDGATMSVNDAGLTVTLDGVGKVQVKFGFQLDDQPRIDGTASLDGPVADGLPVLAKSTITADIASQGPIQLARFADFAGVPGLGGQASLDIHAKTDAGKVHMTHKLHVANLVAPGVDAKTVKPITVSLDGSADLASETGLLDLTTSLTSAAGTNELTFHGKPDELARELRKLDLSTLTKDGRLPALPEFRMTIKGANSIPVLAMAVPALLSLQKGVQVTSGELTISDIVIAGGSEPSIVGGVSLTRLAGTRDGKPVQVAPIVLSIDARQPAGQPLTLESLLLRMGLQSAESPLLDVRASGTMDKASATCHADLGRVLAELGQVFDVGPTKLTGLAIATAGLTRQGEALQVTMTSDWKSVEITPAPAEGAAEPPKPVTISTKVNWTGSLTAENPMTQTGELTIQNLDVRSDGKTFQQQSIAVPYELAFDKPTDTLKIVAFQMTSDPALLAVPSMTGAIADLSGQKLLDLSGSYAADLTRLFALLDQFSPGTSEQFTVGARSEAPFHVSGPLSDPSLETMTGNGALAWQQGKVFGLDVGAAKLEPSLADGTMTLPESSFTAAGGTATLRAKILSKAKDIQALLPKAGEAPLLHIPGKLQVLKDAQLNAEFSKQVLSRVNPLFSQLLKIDGLVSLEVNDVALPLDGKEILRTGAGSGRLDLANVQITPSGALATLAEFAGLSKDKPLPMTITGADFQLTDGAVTFDKMDLRFGESFDMRFRGRVGFDNSVDMVVSIPVRAGLLEKLGVGGSAMSYAKALEGTRVEIPITGTRDAPKIDLKSVDIKSLLKQAAPNLLNQGKDLLPGLLDGAAGKGEPGAKSKPAEQLLRGVLDSVAQPKADKPKGEQPKAAQPKGETPATQPKADPAGNLLRGLLDAAENRNEEKKPAGQ